MAEYETEKKPVDLNQKPVITISREVGCNGVKLANLLASRLNQKNQSVHWKVISKEVFYECARELDMNPEQIRKALNQSEKFVFEGMIKAFNDKHYKSSETIAKTTREVIRHFATEGYCIIIGRAGNIIANDFTRALHVRLIAPLEYRIKTITENNNLNYNDALKFINQVEAERIAFRASVIGAHAKENLFDITLNRGVFSNEAIVDFIEFAAIKKGIFDK